VGIFSKFVAKIKGQSTADPLDWQELETELLGADLGPVLTSQIIQCAKSIKGDDAIASLTQILENHLSAKPRKLNQSETVTVVMVVGVNGTGKTTSVAKLAAHLKGSGNSVVLAAVDTLRAAAVDQLQTWGNRICVQVISGKDGAEPASVAFDAALKTEAITG
jgi:fused signal recognition particle receptor